MIRRMSGKPEFLVPQALLMNRSAHRSEELFRSDMRRARGGHEDAAPLEAGQGIGIEALIGDYGIGALILAQGQGWRIADNEIEHPARASLHPLKGISADALTLDIGDAWLPPIEIKIALGAFQSVWTDVQIRDARSAAQGSIERESSGEREGIEHITTGRELADSQAIFTLVQEKASFLALDHIRFKKQAIFRKNDV